MRVRRVKITNHPGVGDIDLSFADPSGATFPIVVLAGANGTGKTAILESIQLSFEGRLGAQIGHVELDLECNATDIGRLSSVTNGAISAASPPSTITLSYDSSRTDSWDAYQLLWDAGAGPKSKTMIFITEPWHEVFRSFLSEAAIDFQTGVLKNVTTLTLDDPEAKSQRSGQKIAQRIGQLLVDIRAADAEDLSNWVTLNPGAVPPPIVQNIRFSRFEKAFRAMFPHKHFRRVDRNGGEIRVEFEEFGRVSTLNTLSTGEKQIVFRAGFLLQNLHHVMEGIVLVDEPELSLHPEWQGRIVEFYVSLLSDNNGRHPQIIISTHSPFIVHGAAGSKPIILEKDSSTGTVREMPSAYYPLSTGFQSIRAFNIEAFLQTARHPIVLLTEGETDAGIINTAWEKLHPGKPRVFETRAALGDRNISITLNDRELFNRLGGRMIVGLFDFDTAYNQWNGVWRGQASTLVSAAEQDGLIKKHSTGLGWAMLLPVPAHRTAFASSSLAGLSALSIEFMFEDQDIPPNMVAYKALPLGAQVPYFMDSKKMAFAAHARSLPAQAFASFQVVFDRIDEINKGLL